RRRLHDRARSRRRHVSPRGARNRRGVDQGVHQSERRPGPADRKSTRLNSSHDQISYAVFCLKKKKNNQNQNDMILRDQNAYNEKSVHAALNLTYQGGFRREGVQADIEPDRNVRYELEPAKSA